MKAIVDAVMTALMPIFFGAAMAFLVNPLMSRVERRLVTQPWAKKHARGFAIAIAVVVYAVLIYVAVSTIAPNLALSIFSLVEELPGRLSGFIQRIEEQIIRNEQVLNILDRIWAQVGDKLESWLETNLMPNITSTLLSLANGVYSVATLVFDVAKVLFNLVVGIIVMIYLLMSKDKFIGQSKKIVYAVCKNRSLAAAILDVARAANRIFNGFISGKLLDSLIIGIICFICLSIMRIPYALLISVIVGVTNVIPVFGPFIGAIPCAFLLLLVNPMQCLVFVIYIFILQQVDGNIIGPKILGDSTGLSAFWVMFSILLFGKLMGFAGMILGVPLFATFYYVVKKVTEALLRRRELPTETSEYVKVDYIDEKNVIHYLQDEKKFESIRRQMRRKNTINGKETVAKEGEETKAETAAAKEREEAEE